ncbi:DUF1642 domain-containing protein [Enterococcus gilvus]|uniref:DUF1642 domain-containing protein n=1 Tax=Enterococcus gilvus TaxID=160453 RepID=UPI003ED853E4
MNKQEILKKIDKSVETIAESPFSSFMGYSHGEITAFNICRGLIEQLDEPQITDEQAWNKIAEAYPETAQSLRITLDHAVFGQEAEPQKVKVPKEFDGWYKQIEQKYKQPDGFKTSAKRFALWKICQYGFGNGFEDVEHKRTSKTLSNWVGGHKEDAINAVWNGYEVEDEPKYYLDLPKMGMVNEISNSQLCWTNCDGGITEKEIKSIDERYWPFAVPVEKV